MLETYQGNPITTLGTRYESVYQQINDSGVFRDLEQAVKGWLSQQPRKAHLILFLREHNELPIIDAMNETFGLQRCVVVLDIVFRRILIADDECWVAWDWDQREPLAETVFIRKSTMEALWNIPHYRSGIFACMRQALDAYEFERKTYYQIWGEILSEPETIGLKWDEVGHAMLSGAMDLASEKSVLHALNAFTKMCDSNGGLSEGPGETKSRQFNEAIQFSFAKESLQLAVTATERTFELVSMMQPYSPSGRTKEFLRRVSRCYLLGLDTECIVMCRAALETEFEAEVSNDDCISVLGTRKPAYYTLDDRIATATKLGYIEFETAEKARFVKNTGNRAVHRTPGQIPSAREVLEQTMEIIVQLGDAAMSGDQ